jgi:hypothetical protein
MNGTLTTMPKKRGRPRKYPEAPAHQEPIRGGYVLAMWDGETYRCQTSLSYPAPASALHNAQTAEVRIEDPWLYLDIARSAQLVQNGYPVVWLSPDELQRQDLTFDKLVVLAYRRFVGNNAKRALRSRKDQRRYRIDGEIPFEPEQVLRDLFGNRG